MALLPQLLTSTRLAFKGNRFEFASAIVAVVLGTVGALVALRDLAATGASAECLARWVASAAGAGACADEVQRWAVVNENEAGRILALFAVLPFAFGILLGVPLIGRELENRTAAIAWSLGSRTQWLASRVIPMAALTLTAMTFAAVATTSLVAARTAGGIWSSPLADASLNGPPVVARAIAGLGLGLFAGVMVGRTLPAFILAAVAAALLTVASAQIQGSFLSAVPAASEPFDLSGSLERYVEAHPDQEMRFVTPDGRVVSLNEALGAAPVGTDPWTFIQAKYQPLLLGASWRLAERSQLVESVALFGLGGALIGLSFPLVANKRPP